MIGSIAPRIAILVPSIHGGGAEFVAKEWAIWLSGIGIEVDILTTSGVSQPGDYPFSIYPLRGGGFIAHYRSLRKMCIDGSYSCVLSLMPYWNLLALGLKIDLRKRSPAVVISSRNSETSLNKALNWKFRVLTAVACIVYRMCDALVAISHPVAAEVVAKYGVRGSKIWVVPNPATAKFDRVRGSLEPTMLDRGEVVRIVVPARIVEQKRPWLAVEVAEIVGTNRPVELHFFGTGALEADVVSECRRRGVNAIMHGWVESWFLEAPLDGIVLLPSLAEGFGNVLVEACAAGLPSVASSRALGVADAIVPGITGVLVAGDAAADYARGILEALQCDPNVAGGWLNRFSSLSSGKALFDVLATVCPELQLLGVGSVRVEE